MNPCELAKCPYWGGGTLCDHHDAFDGWFCSRKETIVEEALQLLAEKRSHRCIQIWKPEDLPEVYRELVGELDDVNWIALVPHSMKDEYLGFLLHSSMFDSLQEPAMYMTTFGIFYVGSH